MSLVFRWHLKTHDLNTRLEDQAGIQIPSVPGNWFAFHCFIRSSPQSDKVHFYKFVIFIGFVNFIEFVPGEEDQEEEESEDEEPVISLIVVQLFLFVSAS